ncbi:transcription factor S [Halobacteriales archaeon Cl-PHB]
MEFCDECGSMMKAEDGTWVCGSCGYEQARDAENEEAMVTTTGQEETEIVDVSDAEDTGLPTTNAQCPECDNDRAHWYMQQIRAADESETRFFVCTECEHKWREDDH